MRVVYYLCIGVLSEKNLRTFVYILYMTQFSNSQSSSTFYCETCDYMTSRKSQYDRHLETAKHKKSSQRIVSTSEKYSNFVYCDCGKSYKHETSYYKHKKMCKTNALDVDNDVSSNNIILEIVKQNNEFKELIIEQNKQIHEQHKENLELNKRLLEMAKEGKTINNHTVTNNKFNLQFFLNEQCKDALNIMDFVNSLTIKLTDLENVGKLGYSEGISKIFIRGLKELDIFKRPIHCSDLKREILYIKDENAWEKENTEKAKIKMAIKKIANKNMKQIPEWENENPTSQDYDSKKHEEYMKIVNESMGGIDDEEDETNDNKIIKNVAKEVLIDK